MPNDLTVSPISSVSSASAPARNATPEQLPPPPAPPIAASTTVATAPIYPNPSMHVDASANLVVMEFSNAQGDLVSQTPTQQQIQAYTTGASASSAGGDFSSGVA